MVSFRVCFGDGAIVSDSERDEYCEEEYFGTKDSSVRSV